MPQHDPKILPRLARIEGQVRGVARMIEQDRYCIDVLTQVQAIKSALRKVEDELLKSHSGHCVAKAIESGNVKDARKKFSELVDLFEPHGALMKKAGLWLLLSVSAAAAQDMDGMDMGDKSSDQAMSMHGLLGGYAMNRDSSGTSWQPDFAPAMGGMTMIDGWMLMREARASFLLDSQSGPRGDSDAFASGSAMLMASRDLTPADTLGLRAMLSIDPFMGRRGYPLLLQTGETGNGVTPLLDRQHPHDLFMELAASFSHALSTSDSVFVYAGYPGEPALGPSAYMHRVSGMDNPETPITHHWLDSTHISFGVATLGFVHDGWKLEASQFTGREPDQYRFNFDPARFDSTSMRLSWNPGPNWSLQVSGGFLKSPEALTPTLNEQRLTASATYDTPVGDDGSLAMTAAFGSKRLSDGTRENAGLIEAEYSPVSPWTLFARAEWLQSDELVPGGALHDAGKIALGAVHDWELTDDVKLGLGGVYDFDFAPASPAAPYGGGPHGAMAFLRLIAS